MKNAILLICFACLFTAYSCNSARKARTVNVKPKSEKVLMKKLLSNQVKADWMGGKARVTYQDEYGRESFTTYVRMQKDSAIWMSFKKFSIEGARALITPDSIYLVDRINNQYFVKPFDYVQKIYRLPVNFHGLQALLLGNPVFFSLNTEADVDENRYILKQKTDNLYVNYWLDGIKMLLRELFIEDFRNSRSLTLEVSDYQLLPDKQNFSYFRRFNLNSPEMGNMRVDIDFSKVELNVPQNLSFSIPERYERVD